VCGIVNLVPYIGTVIAWVPPIIVGMTKWHSIGPFVTIVVGLTAFHIVALNVMLPAIVGRRVHLSALAGNDLAALLGRDVGRDRPDSGDSHHCRHQGNLRSHPGLGAGGTLVRLGVDVRANLLHNL